MAGHLPALCPHHTPGWWLCPDHQHRARLEPQGAEEQEGESGSWIPAAAQAHLGDLRDLGTWGTHNRSMGFGDLRAQG